MLLYMDDEIISEDVTERELEEILRNLNSDRRYTIMLQDGDIGVMQADGNPEEGYRLSYTDLSSNQTMVSTNAALRPVTIRKALLEFLRGDMNWRHGVSWIDNKLAPLSPQHKQNMRRLKFAVFTVLFGFAFGWVPMVVFAHDIIDALMFIPYCKAYETDQEFILYSTGGQTSSYLGGLVPIPRTRLGNCIYEDYVPVPFSQVIGDAGQANLMQQVANVLTVVLPLGAFALLFGVVVLVLRVTDPSPRKQKKSV